MKTNHQRNFIQEPGPWAGPSANGKFFNREKLGLTLFSEMSLNKIKSFNSNRRKTGKAHGDSTCGKHGLAQQNRGLKKFYNSRARFKTRQLEHALLKIEDFDLVKNDI